MAGDNSGNLKPTWHDFAYTMAEKMLDLRQGYQDDIQNFREKCTEIMEGKFSSLDCTGHGESIARLEEKLDNFITSHSKEHANGIVRARDQRDVWKIALTVLVVLNSIGMLILAIKKTI